MQPLITTLKFYCQQKQKPTQNQIHIEFGHTPIKIYHLYCFKTPKKKKKVIIFRERRTDQQWRRYRWRCSETFWGGAVDERRTTLFPVALFAPKMSASKTFFFDSIWFDFLIVRLIKWIQRENKLEFTITERERVL